MHTLPCAAILRRAIPGARIRWVINTEWMPLLEGNPNIDEVLEFPRREFRGPTTILRVARWARQLRDRVRPDLILDYQGLLRSALISRFCRHKNARLLGLSDAREGSRLFYDEIIDTSACEHAVDRYLALTRAAAECRDQAPLEWVLPEGTRPADFDPVQGYVVFHPFARGEGKSLSPAQVSEFCRVISPTRVVIVGKADESVPAAANVIDLLNRTDLSQLIWLLRHARFTVSVDSGPMHIAAAISHRLVAIHTWSDPAKVGPYRAEAWIWQHGTLFRQSERGARELHREVANLSALAVFVKSQM